MGPKMTAWLCKTAATIIKGFVIIILTISAGEFLFQEGHESLGAIVETFSEYAVSWFKVNLQLSYVIAALVTVLFAWLVGRLKVAKLISFFRKGKGLFCVRMKPECGKTMVFPWNYLVGIVMNECKREEKTYYNICFQNFAGFIVLYKVPKEYTEKVDVEPEDLMAAIPFFGAMELKNL